MTRRLTLEKIEHELRDCRFYPYQQKAARGGLIGHSRAVVSGWAH